MVFCVLKFNLLSCRFLTFFEVIEYSILVPCEQRFLSGMTFSICKVVRMACQSCSWFVYAPRETSARSHLWFPLSMHFRHLHNLEELLFNTELNTTAAGIRCLFQKKSFGLVSQLFEQIWHLFKQVHKGWIHVNFWMVFFRPHTCMTFCNKDDKNRMPRCRDKWNSKLGETKGGNTKHATWYKENDVHVTLLFGVWYLIIPYIWIYFVNLLSCVWVHKGWAQ